MGSSSSITNMENSIYVSYDSGQKNSYYIQDLCNDLKRQHYNVLTSEFTNQAFDSLHDVREMLKTMENIVEHSKLLILCVSKQTLYNYYQTIEMNTALTSNKNILFLMTDRNYTPDNQPLFTNLYQNKWLPLYDIDNVSDVLLYIERKKYFNNQSITF